MRSRSSSELLEEFFRLHLEFYNAHLCGLYGIATYEHGAFVFRDPSEDLESACVLTIRLGKDNVELEDADGGCRSYYSGRAGLSRVRVSRASLAGRLDT
jgi:hypothetical protein